MDATETASTEADQYYESGLVAGLLHARLLFLKSSGPHDPILLAPVPTEVPDTIRTLLSCMCRNAVNARLFEISFAALDHVLLCSSPAEVKAPHGPRLPYPVVTSSQTRSPIDAYRPVTAILNRLLTVGYSSRRMPDTTNQATARIMQPRQQGRCPFHGFATLIHARPNWLLHDHSIDLAHNQISIRKRESRSQPLIRKHLQSRLQRIHGASDQCRCNSVSTLDHGAKVQIANP